jgi:hypothetical protein
MQDYGKDVAVVIENNVPVVFGECSTCNSGSRSLVIIDFVPSKIRSVNGTVYIKCICCNSVYQTKVKDVSR